MKKILNNIKKLQPIDILGLIAFGLYGWLLINTILQWL
jgi:hypothetical protein